LFIDISSSDLVNQSISGKLLETLEIGFR